MMISNFVNSYLMITRFQYISFSLTIFRVTHVALLRRKLITEKQELSLEIAAIDMAFRSLMKNLLSQRYPLIFSPNYREVSIIIKVYHRVFMLYITFYFVNTIEVTIYNKVYSNYFEIYRAYHQ
jgi:hypothetical protein